MIYALVSGKYITLAQTTNPLRLPPNVIEVYGFDFGGHLPSATLVIGHAPMLSSHPGIVSLPSSYISPEVLPVCRAPPADSSPVRLPSFGSFLPGQKLFSMIQVVLMSILGSFSLTALSIRLVAGFAHVLQPITTGPAAVELRA